MSGISLGGLASGMDTDAIVGQLLALERAPRTRIELRQAATQARQDVLRDVAGRLNALRTATTALSSAATWADLQKAESSTPGTATARLTSGAAPGGSSLVVTSLASSAQSTYTFASPGSATTVSVNGHAVPVAAGATLADVVGTINSTPDTGVFAVDVGGSLVLSSRATGALSAAVATGATVTQTATRAGADSVFSVDGTPYTRAGNVVTDVLPGVELTLKAPGTTTVTVSAPAPDQAAVLGRVKDFVKAYNELQGFLRDKLAEKKVPGAATAADAKKGALHADPALRQALAALRSASGTFSDLGISTGAAASGTPDQQAVAGTLTLDETKLTALLSSGSTTARTRLGELGAAMETVLAPLTGSGGLVDQRVTAAGAQLSALKSSLDAFDARLGRTEERLRAQFTALELALQRSSSVSADIAARLGSS